MSGRWRALCFGLLCLPGAHAQHGQGKDADAALKRPLVLDVGDCTVPAGRTSTAEVHLVVSAAGLPTEVVLAKTSGEPCLDAVAVKAIEATEFTPTRRGGKAVSQEVVFPVDFSTTDGTRPGVAAPGGVTPPTLDLASKPDGSACKVAGGMYAVRVGITVDTQGLPTEVRVVHSAGDPCLDAAALATARQYRFHPATRDGHPVPFALKLDVRMIL